MKYFLRLLIASISAVALTGTSALAAPLLHPATTPNSPATANHTSQGYLGIVCIDVTNTGATDLKLKDAKGTEIINVDRDGPAGKAGLRPHDVILQMNGQVITGEQQLRRMLHETPAGRTVSLLISRSGQQKTISVQLADRATVEQNAWTQHVVMPDPGNPGEAFWGESSLHSLGSGLFSVFSVGAPSVGLDLDTLGSQLADYFGVRDGLGLLVKHVSENSPASRAGIKAGDVITKANGERIATLSEWMKMLHANRGKPIQITLIRNRKEQTTTLEAVGKKSHSELVAPPGLQPISNVELAESSSLFGPGMFDPNDHDLQLLEAQMAQQSARMEFEIRQMDARIESMGLAPTSVDPAN
ncbi:MAG TPA: PDZ domain-containing protein [Acidobacteriaceae bacterium]|nr:PDZ domain-containing protein [Acidobacteriaceae bacterium]